jgi:hypothetical protein
MMFQLSEKQEVKSRVNIPYWLASLSERLEQTQAI